MRRVLTRAWAAAMAIAACTPVDSARSPIAPQNTCPEHPCSIYAPYQAGLDSSCTSGVCSVDARFDYTVVVSVPETSFFAPNTTFAISRADLFSRSNIPVCSLSGAVPCVRLPPIAIAQGDYLVQPAVAVDAKFYLGGVNTVLPAHVTYRTLWTASGAGSPTDALAQGLSILPMMGSAIVSQGGTAGPAGGASVAFQANLPPGSYERTLKPDPPFDSAFPPNVSILTIAEGMPLSFDGDPIALDITSPSNPHFPKFNLSRGDGQTMDGSLAFLRDQTTKQTLSSLVTLVPGHRSATPAACSLCGPGVAGCPCVYQGVQLNTDHHVTPVKGFSDALFNTELVVVPPAGAQAQPTLVVPYIGGELPPDEIYPAVPAPAFVSGTVTSSVDQSPVAADLVIVATKILKCTLSTAMPPTAPNCGDPQASFSPNLAYTTSVSTDDQGRFALPMPPGEFEVVITPHVAGLARTTSAKLDVDNAFPQQAGKGLVVDPLLNVHGSATLADGRPLAGAQISARPAAAGQAATNTTGYGPRAALAQTDLAGNFLLELDPGTYDITVMPEEGSHFPWLVSTSRVIAESATGDAGAMGGDVFLEPFVVPAPIVASYVLKDPQANPIIRAIVRIFAKPLAATGAGAGGGAGTGVPTAYVEIGRAMTDTSGFYEMYLAGTPR